MNGSGGGGGGFSKTAMAPRGSGSAVVTESRFEPAGLKLYKPEITIYEPEMVLREPNTHLSVLNRENNKYVRGFGGPANVKAFYKDLPKRAKKLVNDAGFGEIVELLDETSSDHVQMTTLIERWWDTTNTLHFPFGEATLTPLDFAAITGIRVGGDRIPFDMDLYKNSEDLAYLLGRVPDDISGSGTVRYRWFHEQFQEDMKSG